MTTFNLRNVKLRPGEQFRDVVEVELGPLELGGQRYAPVPERPEAVLTLSQTSSGLVLELELETRMLGPCMRCLSDAGLDVHVASREYQASSPGEADELTTPYLADSRLDLSAWAHDAVALALPDKILCRDDCAGLCPVCGRDLNKEPHEHEGEAADPRWAALSELRDRL
ncbi:MAG: YceD family protein [Gaiellaceae bacterium]